MTRCAAIGWLVLLPAATAHEDAKVPTIRA